MYWSDGEMICASIQGTLLTLFTLLYLITVAVLWSRPFSPKQLILPHPRRKPHDYHHYPYLPRTLSQGSIKSNQNLPGSLSM
jgi:hypothetical protein